LLVVQYSVEFAPLQVASVRSIEYISVVLANTIGIPEDLESLLWPFQWTSVKLRNSSAGQSDMAVSRPEGLIVRQNGRSAR
jgi:hypothetical protein